MFPKPKQNPFALWIGGHNLEAVERALRFGTGWLPGWRPWPELEERIRWLKEQAVALGRDPASIEIAPQFSVTIAKTVEEPSGATWPPASSPTASRSPTRGAISQSR